jgi:transcriptional regulator with XRE-family HTH domain
MSKKLAKHERFDDQLRRLIDASGLTRYAIAKETGITQAALSRFMAGKAGLSMPNLNTLAELLGWQVVLVGKPKSKSEK